MDKYFLYEGEYGICARLVGNKPIRRFYEKMEIDCFEDVEMEWQQKFDKAPEVATHPNRLVQEYFKEQMLMQEMLNELCEGIIIKICNETKWFPCQCESCGWVGSSEKLEGGHQIADTGDYSDCYCPSCLRIISGDELANDLLVPNENTMNSIRKRLQLGLDNYVTSAPNDERSVATDGKSE